MDRRLQPAFTEQGLVKGQKRHGPSEYYVHRSVDASYKEMSSWRRAKLLIRCLKLSPGTPEYVEAQQKSTLCRVLLDLKRSSEWKARCVLQARRQQRGTHRRSLSTHRTDTAPMHCPHAVAKYSQAFSEYSPHRCSPRSTQLLTGVLGVLTAPMRCTPTRAPSHHAPLAPAAA